MAGFREFLTGEVLTAANVNNFLMKQSVMVFADAAARTAALGAEVVEGMLTYNEDTAQLEVYDGAAFVLAAPAPPAGIGTNVVQGVFATSFSTTSATFQDTGLTATITPTSDTSKILALFDIALGLNNDAGAARIGQMRVLRGATAIGVGAEGSRTPGSSIWQLQGSFRDNINRTSVHVLDSPNAATAVTYKAQIRAATSGELVYLNRGHDYTNNNNYVTTASSITLIEVAP